MRLFVRRRSLLLLGVVLLVAGLPPAAPRLSSYREDAVRVRRVVCSASTRCSLQAMVERDAYLRCCCRTTQQKKGVFYWVLHELPSNTPHNREEGMER